jgi:hypothetical protein
MASSIAGGCAQREARAAVLISEEASSIAGGCAQREARAAVLISEVLVAGEETPEGAYCATALILDGLVSLPLCRLRHRRPG